MNHQDFTPITIGKKSLTQSKDIILKNKEKYQQQHNHKIDQESENFKITRIPRPLSQEISNIRNLRKMSQKDLANRLNIPKEFIPLLENGKAIYDGKTKVIINKIQNVFGVKFKNK